MFAKLFQKCCGQEDDSHVNPKPTQQHGTTPQLWAPNSRSCELCEGSFGMLRARHHCRQCGINVCGGCSPFTAMVAGYLELQRVCRCCHAANATATEEDATESSAQDTAEEEQSSIDTARVQALRRVSDIRSSSSSALQVWRQRSEEGHVEVSIKVNVYHLTTKPASSTLGRIVDQVETSLGRMVGVYHSGIEIDFRMHNGEYTNMEESMFGASATTGKSHVLQHAGKCAGDYLPAFKYHSTVDYKSHRMPWWKFCCVSDEACAEWEGPESKYHLIHRNCNCYCQWMLERFSGKTLPTWINRTATFTSRLSRRVMGG